MGDYVPSKLFLWSTLLFLSCPSINYSILYYTVHKVDVFLVAVHLATGRDGSILLLKTEPNVCNQNLNLQYYKV